MLFNGLIGAAMITLTMTIQAIGTTLGYGDITLAGDSRVASGIEALDGILLVGWSTAVLFAIVQRIWQSTSGAAGKD